ncbi:MAG: NADH-quinone oxidoreductase subunit N [Gammaproteobacteria bacterium]|nr:NADH-quinone oxidoreductase subunit N [Gammaproteobacteria bacterium]
MSSIDYLALAPHITLTAAIMLLVLLVSFWRNHLAAMILTVGGFAGAFAALFFAIRTATWEVTPLYLFDGFAAFFDGMILIAAAVTALISFRYLDGRTGRQEEYYLLLALATLGAMTLVSAQHFASLLLGLEIVSISLYALVAYPEEGNPPLEAALKYLVLSGVGSTIMLFGMALVYHATGTMAFDEMGRFAATGDRSDLWLAAGQAILVAGIAFKLSLVPFHMWTPDVYQGAPAPVTAYLATVSKAAVFAVLLRFAFRTDMLDNGAVFGIVAIMAILSMVAGNLLALLQESVKRILAYSSIAHLGYLMIGLLAVAALADHAMALETSLVFLAGYLAMTLTAFAVVTELTPADRATDVDLVNDYTGLFWRRPVLASVFTVALLSLAGIPLTAGFIAKFYLFAAGVEGALWTLIWAMILGSAISIYYYLKIVFAMTARADDVQHRSASWAGTVTAVGLALLVVALGTYPTPLIELVRMLVDGIG